MEVKKQESRQGLTNILKLFQKNNFLVILCVAGIALVFLSSSLFGGSKNSKTEQNLSQIAMSREEFTTQLEQRLKNVLSSVRGVGECQIMVSLENGVQYVYATESKKNETSTVDKGGGTDKNQSNNETDEKYIIINDAAGGEKALIVTELEPKIKGVAVVCAGADDISVKKNIIDMVTTLLNIPSNKISVMQSGAG